MGAISRVFKKATKAVKKVTKGVTKAFKKVGKGIAKVGKGIWNGVKKIGGAAFKAYGKLSSKLGPVGMIGLSMAMPYLMPGFTSAAGGDFSISLGSTDTNNIPEGRYVYDVLVSSGATTYKIVSGNVLVIAGISSAPVTY